MKALLWLSHIFVNTFGITQPTPDNERHMALFIGALLAALALGVFAAALLLRASFRA